MSHLKLISLFSLLVYSVAHAETVTDFNYWELDSIYGSWAPDQSAEVSSGVDAFSVVASNFGGAYKYLPATAVAPNISGMNHLGLKVTVNSQSNGSKGIGFLIFLEDEDGTVYKYSRFGVQQGVHTLHWLLASPSSLGEAGTVEGFDASYIKAMHVQVDPGGANDYDVDFLSLVATAEVPENRAIVAPSVAPASAVSSIPSYKTLKAYAYIDQANDPRYARCLMDVYYPEHLSDFPAVVFIHAGGLRNGQRYIPGELMNKGFAVISISYSLYPDAKSPEFIEDTAAAVAWAFTNIENVGGSKDKIFVSGSSAGGYLAMMVGLDKKWLSEFGVDANDLAGIISLSGQAITHVAIREEKGGHRAKPVVDALAPLNHVRGDASPLLLVTGDRELELLGRYEENAYLKRMMEINGHKATELHEIKGADHGGVEKLGHEFLKAFVKRVAEM